MVEIRIYKKKSSEVYRMAIKNEEAPTVIVFEKVPYIEMRDNFIMIAESEKALLPALVVSGEYKFEYIQED